MKPPKKEIGANCEYAQGYIDRLREDEKRHKKEWIKFGLLIFVSCFLALCTWSYISVLIG